jgi:predicted RNA binding protein YcfA (HicA-like mRNA interferase family)
MVSHEKVLERILRGTSDASIGFADLCTLLRRIGFQERVKGSHHIFFRSDIAEIINIQPRGSEAKPYQVKQVRQVILRHGLGGISGTE